MSATIASLVVTLLIGLLVFPFRWLAKPRNPPSHHC